VYGVLVNDSRLLAKIIHTQADKFAARSAVANGRDGASRGSTWQSQRRALRPN
jgi:hypothetical protein